MIEVVALDRGVTFAVRVVPRASCNAIEGEYAGALKIRLTAPPVEGRANEALRRFLAERLNVPIAAVRIVGGEKNRTKRVSVEGVSAAQVLVLCVPLPKATRSSQRKDAGRRQEN